MSMLVDKVWCLLFFVSLFLLLDVSIGFATSEETLNKELTGEIKVDWICREAACGGDPNWFCNGCFGYARIDSQRLGRQFLIDFRAGIRDRPRSNAYPLRCAARANGQAKIRDKECPLLSLGDTYSLSGFVHDPPDKEYHYFSSVDEALILRGNDSFFYFTDYKQVNSDSK